jgi:hypothetical protein
VLQKFTAAMAASHAYEYAQRIAFCKQAEAKSMVCLSEFLGVGEDMFGLTRFQVKTKLKHEV